MRIFDTRVQELKYKVLLEVAWQTWRKKESFAVFNSIADEIVKKDEPPMSCCIYKDRAIVAERIKIAIGEHNESENVIKVINIACDECPVAGHVVTDLCRGCVAHRCADVCGLNAIYFDDEQMAHIDKEKCVECGKCVDVCPYSAINNFKRPCEKSCKVDAISMGKDGAAYIDNDKCIACGACVYQCPFGATVDESSIVDIIKELMKAKEENRSNVYAMIAPAMATQFTYAKQGQVVTAIRELGFSRVLEAALGADMVAEKEAEELAEKDFLTSSCCPAFVKYIETQYPELKDNISHNLSPMAELGRFIKEREPDCKIVFIGPCTAKKEEAKKGTVKDYIDYVLTFEELQALIDSKDIIVEDLEESSLEDASYYGRIFARSGGVTAAVAEAISEEDINLEFNPVVCQSVDECRIALLKASKGVLDNNFIEGMVCTGGCIGGAGCISHRPAKRKVIDDFGKESKKADIKEAIKDAENLL